MKQQTGELKKYESARKSYHALGAAAVGSMTFCTLLSYGLADGTKLATAAFFAGGSALGGLTYLRLAEIDKREKDIRRTMVQLENVAEKHSNDFMLTSCNAFMEKNKTGVAEYLDVAFGLKGSALMDSLKAGTKVIEDFNESVTHNRSADFGSEMREKLVTISQAMSDARRESNERVLQRSREF